MKRRLLWVLAAMTMVNVSARQGGPAPPPPPRASGGPPAAAAATPATGLILGRVIDATTTRPVAGATVSFAAAAPSSAGGSLTATRVFTDSQGRFVLRDLPKGSVTVTATKPGYVSGAYGKRSPSGTGQLIELADGEGRADVTISLWKYGVIGGRVTDESGEPMIGVQVRVLRRAIVAGKWQLTDSFNQFATDDRGIYRIGSLVPGQYVVGVVSTSAGTPVELYEAYVQAIASGSTDLTRSIDPAASLSSSAGLRVADQVLSTGVSGSGIGASQSPSIRFDDQARRLLVYPTVFYPSAPTVTQADVVTVGAGTEQSSIDFQLRPAPAVTVSGSVVGPDGPSPNTALQLLPSGIEMLQREYGFEAATAISDRKGAFTFVGVVPGQYVIRVIKTPQRPQDPSTGVTSVVQIGSTTISSTTFAGPSTQPPIPDDPTLWGALNASIGETDVSGLTLVLHAGVRVGGHVEFSGSAAKPAPAALAQLVLTVDASDGRAPGSISASSIINRLQVDGQGQLHSYQLPAGKYLVRASAPSGWTFAGAFLNGIDVSASPFEVGAADIENLVVRYTDHPAELSGTVRDDGRLVGRGSTVLMFPADPRGWTDYGTTARRFRSMAASTGGTYHFSGVADGEYLVAAVGGGDVPSDWQEAEFLKKLAPIASRVTIAGGDKKVQDLRVSAPR